MTSDAHFVPAVHGVDGQSQPLRAFAVPDCGKVCAVFRGCCAAPGGSFLRSGAVLVRLGSSQAHGKVVTTPRLVLQVPLVNVRPPSRTLPVCRRNAIQVSDCHTLHFLSIQRALPLHMRTLTISDNPSSCLLKVVHSVHPRVSWRDELRHGGLPWKSGLSTRQTPCHAHPCPPNLVPLGIL